VKERVLVLNQDYQAIGVCSVERAFVLVYLEKAEMVQDIPTKSLRSAHRAYRFPSIIRLYEYVRLPYRKVALSRANIFRRDDYQCVYCGARSDLTLDHIVPRSMGGGDTWENLATACQNCNTRKGNRTPEQASMPMRKRIYRPSYIMYLSNYNGTIDDAWNEYLMIS
jgi:5-methylcytosine-specific restriction endonuclease McrA